MNLAMTHLPTKPGCPDRAARLVSVAATTGTQVGHYAYIGLGYAANAGILGKCPDPGEVGEATTDLVTSAGIHIGTFTVGAAIGDIGARDQDVKLCIIHEHFQRQIQRGGAVVLIITAVAIVGIGGIGGVVRTVIDST